MRLSGIEQWYELGVVCKGSEAGQEEGQHRHDQGGEGGGEVETRGLEKKRSAFARKQNNYFRPNNASVCFVSSARSAALFFLCFFYVCKYSPRPPSQPRRATSQISTCPCFFTPPIFLLYVCQIQDVLLIGHFPQYISLLYILSTTPRSKTPLSTLSLFFFSFVLLPFKIHSMKS